MQEFVDPRGAPSQRRQRRGGGQNTASFDPHTTMHRPDIRVVVHPTGVPIKTISADDLALIHGAITPSALGDQYTTVKELLPRMLDETRDMVAQNTADAQFTSWHEGCHLLAKQLPPTAVRIAAFLMEMFDVDPKTAAVRYNFYNGQSDWKALHHDSAAFNAQRARVQNVTIGASFGDTRELILQHTKGADVRIPCTDGSVYMFGRSVNIRFMHGIAAIPEEERDDTKRRVSIIVWGNSRKLQDEPGDPGLIRQEGSSRPHAHRRRRGRNERRKDEPT